MHQYVVVLVVVTKQASERLSAYSTVERHWWRGACIDSVQFG